MPIDLKAISKKTYNSFDDLRKDFEWFIHNCRTIHRNRDIVKAATNTSKFLENEIRSIILCGQCYEHRYYHPEDGLSMLCDPPHLLLWVDCEQYCYWPAKLMRCEGNDNVMVQYFGDSTISTVASKNCLMFSNTIPKNAHGIGSGNKSFDDAVKVIHVYTDNVVN